VGFEMIQVFRESNSCTDRLTNLGVKNRVEFVQYSTLRNYIKVNFLLIISFNFLYFVCKNFFLFYMDLVWSPCFVFCSLIFFNNNFFM